MADIRDFQSYLEKKRAEEVAKQEAVAAPAVATAIHVDHITHDPEWDLYIHKLTERKVPVTAQRDQLLLDIVKAMPTETREGLMASYWRCQGFIEAIDLAMALPKTLLVDAKGRA